MLTGPGPPDSGAIADVVMEFDADEAVDVPSELVAVTVKVYAVEAVSPVIVIVPAVAPAKVPVKPPGDESRIEEWLGSELRAAIGSDVEVEWVAAAASEGESGIVAVHVMTPSGVVRLD